MNKTLLLRRKLVAYADYCIAFKKLATYEDFAKQVGMMPGNMHISSALGWLAELDLVNNHPIRSSIFVKIPSRDNSGNIVRASIPGEGYFEFCREHGVMKEGISDKDFWIKQIKKFGYKEEDLKEEYGVTF
jgi:hypothetical protein